MTASLCEARCVLAQPTLYPAIAPYDSGFLRVSPIHELYWEQSGNGAYITTTLSKYRTSPGYAFFGASSFGTPINSASGYLAQTVSVPSTAVSVSLTFYTYITTEELTTSVQHDKLFVRVISGGTSYFARIGAVPLRMKTAS